MKAKSEVSFLNIVLETAGINGHRNTYSMADIMQGYWALSVEKTGLFLCH